MGRLSQTMLLCRSPYTIVVLPETDALDVENNYWTNWVQENFGDKYNITVEYVGITRSDVMTDYAMLAASQSLPTICMEYDYDKLASWQADGYLQTYDVEEFKQIAPTYWGDHGRARQRCLHQAG